MRTPKARDSCAFSPLPRFVGIRKLPVPRAYSTCLLNMVVGSLAGDDHVVDVGFAQTGIRDADETGIVLEFLDGSAAQIAHAGAQSTDKLVNHRFQRPTVGDAALDAFRDELRQSVLGDALPLGNIAAGRLL